MNKFCKALVPVVLVIALLVASMPAFAASSPTTKAIGKVTVPDLTYNAKTRNPTVRVYDENGKKIAAKYYTVKFNKKTLKNAGKYSVTVTAKAPYTGKVTESFLIKRARNPFKIVVGKKKFKYNKKKTQSTSIKITGVKENAHINKWQSSSNKVYVKGGKLYVKKGFKGTAVVSISVNRSKKGNYKWTQRSVTITVK